jgi:class 3 adenylate cyclase
MHVRSVQFARAAQISRLAERLVVKELPTGVLTFLFTDVVGSMQLWECNPAETGRAMALHDEIITREIESAGGVVVRLKGEGDAALAEGSSLSPAKAIRIVIGWHGGQRDDQPMKRVDVAGGGLGARPDHITQRKTFTRSEFEEGR